MATNFRPSSAAAPSARHPRTTITTTTRPALTNAQVRKRRCTTKTRSGCLTCKRRRIRCDEHKPQCWNCLKAKHRVCEGYQPPTSRIDSDNHTMLDEDISPPTSATAGSSSATSSSASSNTSASPTPVGAHAPGSLTASSNTGCWPQHSPVDYMREQFPSSSALDSQQPLTAQTRSATLATSIVRDPATPVYRHASTPGYSTVPVEDLALAPPALGTPVANCTVDRVPPKLTTQLLTQRDLHLSHPNHSALTHRPHRQPAFRGDMAPFASVPLPSPFTLTPKISPLIADPVSARCFAFYIRHSGAAMGARSSPAFFLATIPQVASSYAHVRYALLAVALVDESVNDHATDNGKYGPGIGCINHEARKASFEMYGRAVRALVEAKEEDSSSLIRSRLEHDNALAATLITCLLLFSFENWLWNLRNAGRHLEGAIGLMQNYEDSMLGQSRRMGLLEDKVLPMMMQAAKYHSTSLDTGVPASKFGQGATWAPPGTAAVVA